MVHYEFVSSHMKFMQFLFDLFHVLHPNNYSNITVKLDGQASVAQQQNATHASINKC